MTTNPFVDAFQPASVPPAVFTLVSSSGPTSKVDPLQKERRRVILELAKQAFLGGKTPLPFAVTCALSADNSGLPFIRASRIVVTSPTSDIKATFENVLCLWDTGAHASFIVFSQLPEGVRDGRVEGTAFMEIECDPFFVTRDSRFC